MGEKGWSQTRLAEASGVSRPTIWGILRRKADTSDETLEKLARALGVSPPELPTGNSRSSLVPEPAAVYETPDADELEEQLRTFVRHADRTVRFMLGPDATTRDQQLEACRWLMKSAELAGRPVPPALTKIYNEVIEGRFR